MPPRVRSALRIEGSRTCKKVTVRKESMQSRWDFTLRRRLDQCLSAGDSQDRATEMASPECVKAYDAGVEEGLHGPFSPRLCVLSFSCCTNIAPPDEAWLRLADAVVRGLPAPSEERKTCRYRNTGASWAGNPCAIQGVAGAVGTATGHGSVSSVHIRRRSLPGTGWIAR